MGRFIVRRTASLIGVLIAISILTFLIFQAIPNPPLGWPDASLRPPRWRT